MKSGALKIWRFRLYISTWFLNTDNRQGSILIMINCQWNSKKNNCTSTLSKFKYILVGSCAMCVSTCVLKTTSYYSIMKRKGWSNSLSTSTKLTIISYLKSLNTKKTITFTIGNQSWTGTGTKMTPPPPPNF